MVFKSVVFEALIEANTGLPYGICTGTQRSINFLAGNHHLRSACGNLSRANPDQGGISTHVEDLKPDMPFASAQSIEEVLWAYRSVDRRSNY